MDVVRDKPGRFLARAGGEKGWQLLQNQMVGATVPMVEPFIMATSAEVVVMVGALRR